MLAKTFFGISNNSIDFRKHKSAGSINPKFVQKLTNLENQFRPSLTLSKFQTTLIG
jgi:hypothetical protein